MTGGSASGGLAGVPTPDERGSVGAQPTAGHGVAGDFAGPVRAYIRAHESEIDELLEELVSIQSFSGSTEQDACQTAITRSLALSPSIRIDRWRPDWSRLTEIRDVHGEQLFLGTEEGCRGPDVTCIVATVGEGRPHLMLNGHVDVVTAEPDDSWSSPPFEPTRLGRRLVGRGTMDMKAGVVAGVFALRAIADLDLPLVGSVSLSSVPEEEVGGNGTLAVLAHGHDADGWVFLEPSDLRVQHRHHGILSFRIDFEGRAGGILHRSWGVSALTAVGRALTALAQLEQDRTARAFESGGYGDDDLPGFVNAGFASGGEWLATRAAHAQIRGLMGVLPGEPVRDARAELRRAVMQAVSGDDWFAAHPPRFAFPPSGHAGAELPADHPLVDALLGAGDDLDIRLTPSRAGTMVCDAKIVAGGGFAPAVVFGPIGEGLHSANESVDLDSVYRCAEVLALTACQPHLADLRSRQFQPTASR